MLDFSKCRKTKERTRFVIPAGEAGDFIKRSLKRDGFECEAHYIQRFDDSTFPRHHMTYEDANAMYIADGWPKHGWIDFLFVGYVLDANIDKNDALPIMLTVIRDEDYLAKEKELYENANAWLKQHDRDHEMRGDVFGGFEEEARERKKK